MDAEEKTSRNVTDECSDRMLKQVMRRGKIEAGAYFHILKNYVS